jgi:hypothetical protein
MEDWNIPQEYLGAERKEYRKETGLGLRREREQDGQTDETLVLQLVF